MLFMTAALAALTLVQQTDTTLAVSRDTRLSVNNFEGSILVTGWNRNEVRVQATSAEESQVKVRLGGGVLRISQNMRYGPETVDLRISVPAWMPVELEGVETSISVSGTQGPVSAQSVEGDVTLRGGGGNISLSSVEGGVSAEDTKGNVEVTSVEGDVLLRNVAGEVSVESVDGQIMLEGITSTSVRATTVDGDITFAGGIVDGGRYGFTTHDGNLTIRPAGKVNATVSVSTFSGEFESTSPVTVTRTQSGGNRFSFTVGTGSARLDLEAFDGSIRFEYGSR
jgi:DUF4097 and DUF4098 domain-containing protein YvlB